MRQPENIGIGKSAACKRVRSVESELGASVVLAVGKEIVPADAGNIYLNEAAAAADAFACG